MDLHFFHRTKSSWTNLADGARGLCDCFAVPSLSYRKGREGRAKECKGLTQETILTPKAKRRNSFWTVAPNLVCGHCPHPSNHVMEGFTNHLVVSTIACNPRNRNTAH